MLGAFLMEGGVGGEDEEVVHIDDKPPFSDHVTERVVHESLEGSRGVSKTEEHHCGFKQPLMGDEGCLPLVTIFDSYIVAPPSNVKLGENFGVA